MMKSKANKKTLSLPLTTTSTTSSKVSTSMSKKQSHKPQVFLFNLFFLVAFAAFAPLPSSSSLSHSKEDKVSGRKFEIEDDMFWKDGKPFQIIGGDLHYFRVLPQYWEDRLMKAKALGLNTIQTYIPWNLHEPEPGKLNFDGIADIVSFLKMCQKLGFLVMLRPGPYICAEWDLGGFPAWLLAIKPPLRLRTSDPAYLQLVDKWWGILLPKVAPFLYHNGGPIIMVQIENEYGSYGDDKPYLHHLVKLARGHLSDDIILYTTDGGARENLEKGTIRGDAVFSAVDFTTGDDPWPIFNLQKKYNAPGKSPPLSSEFYTGWLTHWGEKIAKTDADFTAAALERILSRNASAVLYMAHGGTNFGFYNGANTGADESDYKADLTSYDYDAPIRESGDIDNDKFKALQQVIKKYHAAPLPSVPPSTEKKAYGSIHLQKKKPLLDLLDVLNPAAATNSDNPLPMEYVGQMFGFMLYVSEYTSKNGGNTLLIPKVHDRAQVFLSCPSEENGAQPRYVGKIERWSNKAVENMGHVNYGPHMFDMKGILSSVYLDGEVLTKWTMFPISPNNLNEIVMNKSLSQGSPGYIEFSTDSKWMKKLRDVAVEPAFYAGHFLIDNINEINDTFISFNGWGKGVAFVNEFNIGRYWPTFGPQCNLYVPAPVLREGENVVVILELETPNPELVIHSVDKPDYTCGLSHPGLHQL